MDRTSLKSGMTVFLLWLAGLGAAAQFAKIAVPFAFVRANYPEAGAEIGWLLTLISALGAILGMTAGIFVARFGLGRTVVIALLLGGVISIWQSTLPSLPAMFASRLIEGLSHLMIVVAAPTLIAQLASDRYRGVCMTLWSTFFGVSFALVAWLGLPMVAASGLGALWMAHGLSMLLLALILAGMLSPTKALEVEPQASDQEHATSSIMAQHFRAYSSPRIAAPAIGWLFYTMTFVSLLAVLPDLLSEASRAITVTLMPLVSIAVSLIVVSTLLTRYAATNITTVGFALSAVAILTIFVGAPLPAICITLFAILGLVQGASFAAVPELNATSETRALANGAMAQMGNIGNLLGTPVLLMVVGVTGTNGLVWSVAALYIAGAIAHVILGRMRRRTWA